MQSIDFNESDKYNDFPLLVQAITDHLDFKKWGFDMRVFPSRTLGDFSSAIIFQSESCKVRYWTFRDRPYEQPEIYFTYGRLHAPNEKHIMIWNGRECHCWHNHLFLYIVLGFLDGLSPQEVAKKEFPYYPELISKFNKEALGGWSQHERHARFQNTIWNHYGKQLFDIFDTRMPDLWNKFIDFYQEFRSEVTRFEFCYKANIC